MPRKGAHELQWIICQITYERPFISLESRWLWAPVFQHFHFRFIVARSIEAVVFGNLVLSIGGRSRAHRLAIRLHTICTESGYVGIDPRCFWLASRCWWFAGFTECSNI